MPDFTLLSGINTNLYNIYDYQNFNKMILEFCYGEVCVKIKKKHCPKEAASHESRF